MAIKLTRMALVLLCIVSLHLGAYNQSIPAEHLSEALQNNLALQTKKVTLQQSLVALQEAKSLFLPTTWLEGQYTLAQGGRSIDIPVGDLMNPVYKTLNQLTNSNNFPTINNVSEQLLPNNFYDIRIKTTLPVLNPDLSINKTIKSQQVTLQEQDIATYQRALVQSVKLAYFNYQNSKQAIAIYQHALELVQQSLRVNEALLKNGKGLPAYVSRAESEVQAVKSQLQNANNQMLNAKAYFNFLLNKQLDATIIDTTLTLPTDLLQRAANTNVSGREELRAIETAIAITGNQLKMNQRFNRPRLNAFVDLGAQGFDFKTNNKTAFYLAGLQLQIPIYSGNRNLYKIKQTQFAQQNLLLTQANTQQQLQLAAYISSNNISSSYSNYQSALKQQQSANSYFNLIEKGYQQGVNTYIELLDARTQLTNAALQVNISQLNVLTALATLERDNASFPIK